MKNLRFNLTLFALLLLLLVTNRTVFAQKPNIVLFEKSDFEGVWLLESTSRSVRKLTYKDRKPLIYFISTQEAAVKFKRIIFIEQKPFAEEWIHYTDGRGEKHRAEELRPNPARPISTLTKSKTKWGYNFELIIESIIDRNAPVGMLRSRIFESWNLSQDKNILIRKVRFIDDNENQAYQWGDLAPSRYEEWKETFRRVPQQEIEKLDLTKKKSEQSQ